VPGTILVVEDDREIRELLRRYLQRAGFAVHTTASGAEALRIVENGGLALVLLDLGLPDIDGLEILDTARRTAGVPVVVLTARSSVDDRIRGLEHGADDYVTKPFSPTEVVLRVQAVLHRAGIGAGTTERGSGLGNSSGMVSGSMVSGGMVSGSMVGGGRAVGRGRVGGGAASGAAGAASFGDGRLRLDEVRHESWYQDERLELTPTEWGILSTLAATPGRVYSRYELVNQVRGYEFAGYERTIDSHVKNLRRKLGPDGAEVIATVLGVGYRMGLERDR
jgi:DNA-binding response OmpR family regulator